MSPLRVSANKLALAAGIAGSTPSRRDGEHRDPRACSAQAEAELLHIGALTVRFAPCAAAEMANTIERALEKDAALARSEAALSALPRRSRGQA